MKNSIKLKNIVSIFALVAILILNSCGKDNPVDPNTQRAINYISKNNISIFKQESFENNIKTDLGDLRREFVSSKNDEFTYKYSPVLTGKDINEILIPKGNIIWTNFTKKIEVFGQNINIDLNKIPIMNLDISAEQLYLDTILKIKVDIKDIVESIEPININIDLKIISKLAPKADESLTVKSISFLSKAFVNKITFTAKTNDPLLKSLRPDLNDLLVASGSFEIENWFTEQNTLGLVYHSETTKIKDEYFSMQEVVNSTLTRTIKDFAISEK